jgi:hypothetical protein
MKTGKNRRRREKSVDTRRAGHYNPLWNDRHPFKRQIGGEGPFERLKTFDLL